MPFFFFSRGRIGGLTWACGGLSIYYFDWQTVPDATAGSTISFRTRVGIAGCVYLFFLFLALDFGKTKVPNFARCISTCFFHDRIIYHYFCHPFPPHDWTVHGSDTLVLHPLWSLLVRFLHVPPQHQKNGWSHAVGTVESCRRLIGPSYSAIAQLGLGILILSSIT